MIYGSSPEQDAEDPEVDDPWRGQKFRMVLTYRGGLIHLARRRPSGEWLDTTLCGAYCGDDDDTEATVRDILHAWVTRPTRGAGCGRCGLYLRLPYTQLEADQYKAMFKAGFVHELEPALQGEPWEPGQPPLRTYGDRGRKVQEAFSQ